MEEKRKPLDVMMNRYAGLSPATSKTDYRDAARWLGYTAAAGSALALCVTADASVIYSGTQNATITADINSDSIFDFQFFASTQTNTTYNTGVGTSTITIGQAQLDGLNGASFIQNLGDVQMLASGDVISAGFAGPGSFGSFGIFRATTYYNSTNPPLFNGQWSTGTDTGLVGARIPTGSGDLFAWLRFQISNNSSGFPGDPVLIDWAYEDTGNPILAGATSGGPSPVPLPGSLGLMAMGIGGLAALRRRRKGENTVSNG